MHVTYLIDCSLSSASLYSMRGVVSTIKHIVTIATHTLEHFSASSSCEYFVSEIGQVQLHSFS